VQIDPEDFKRHYAMLSDAALLEINRDELVDVARACYDAELAERDLAFEEPEPGAAMETAASEAHGELQLVGTFLSIEEANFARGLLQSADVPCSLENEFSAAYSGAGALRLLVPAAAYDRACEILEAEISEEDLIAQAEAEAAEDSPES
jgi:Putative prokaryotic signal transducing protein